MHSHTATHKINGIFWFRTREPIFGEHEMRLADACLLRQELRLFCDSNPIFLFDIHQTFKTHLIVHRLCRFCGGCCCYWAWVSVCARHFFPWEIFNQKHADRFYGVFFSFYPRSKQKNRRRRTRTKAHSSSFANLRLFGNTSYSKMKLQQQEHTFSKHISCDVISIFCRCIHSFVTCSIRWLIRWQDELEAIQNTKIKNKNKKLEEIKQQDTQISLQKKIYLKMGINETFGNEIRQKQTNWFESLDQPSTPVRK